MLNYRQELSWCLLVGWNSTHFPRNCLAGPLGILTLQTWCLFTRSHGVSFYACISVYLAKMQKDPSFRFLELFFCIAPFFPELCPHFFQLSQPFLSSVYLPLLREVSAFLLSLCSGHGFCKLRLHSKPEQL